MFGHIRPRTASYAVAALTAIGALLALLGVTRAALAVLIAVAGLAALVGIDTNSRIRRTARDVRQVAERQRDIRRAISRVLDRIGVLRAVGREKAAREGALAGRVDARLESMERRYLASFEAERLRSADRHREAMEILPSLILGPSARDVESALSASVKELTAVAREETREVEALFQLMAGAQPRALTPPSGRWAMDARALVHLRDLVRRQSPSQIVELGSGTSTVWIGYWLEGLGRGRVVSLDHDSRFAARSREALARHGLDAWAEVRYAPLAHYTEGNRKFRWYDESHLVDVDSIDMLVVDGPPASVGPRARGPALPRLWDRLAPEAMIVLDDGERSDEAAILESWLAEYPELRRVDVGVSRLAVLQRTQQ